MTAGQNNKRHRFTRRFSGAFLALLMLLCGCGRQPETQKRMVFCMDTVFTLYAFGERAEETLRAAEEELYRLDGLLNRHSETSAVAALNREGTSDNGELIALLERAGELTDATGGAFDVTVAPLIDAWDIAGGGRVVPEEEREALLRRVGFREHVCIENGTVTLTGGAEVDLGGIGKGYAAERVRALYATYGTGGALNLGGDACLIGTKADGTPWQVGIRDPETESGIIGVLPLSKGFIETSGAYERFFTGQDGTRYGHILNPLTGAPAESGLVSVTVLSDDGAAADAFCTALYVMGETDARAFLRTHPEISAVLVTEDGRILYPEALWETPPQTEGYVYEGF